MNSSSFAWRVSAVPTGLGDLGSFYPGLRPGLLSAVPSGLRPVSTDTEELGGADRDRTGDPLLAKQVLSQLSYSPLTL